MSCPLCELEDRTKLYYSDDVVDIRECDTCGIPLVTLKRHTMRPTAREIERMAHAVSYHLGYDATVRTTQRDIQDHYHWHIEKEASDGQEG